MAAGKSGHFDLTGSKGITMRIYWAETYEVATNRSTVSITSIQVTSSWYYGAPYYPTGTITINGTTVITMNSVIPTHSVTVPALNEYGTLSGNMGSVSNILHNDDGSKSVTISVDITGYTADGKYGSGWKVSGSESVALTTIARTSEPTVSASTVQMGSPVTIKTNRKATSLTHTLTYIFGGTKGTIATGVGDSYQWTVPDLAAKISGATIGECTITCQTFSGDTLVGAKSVGIVLSVPAASVPTVSASTVQMGTSLLVYTNRKSTAYTHEITYKIGNKTDTISGSASGSVSWTPPKSLAAYTGNKKSATCTLTCKTYNGTALVGIRTVDLTLEVPPATFLTLSAKSVAVGNTITISTPREADVYTHDLTYTIAGETGTIATNVGTEYQWPVPTDLATKIPSDTSAVVTVTCTTRFSGSTVVVGTSDETFTVTVPNNENTPPKINKMSTECISDLPSKFAGIYVVGKTKVKVSYEATSDYSTINSYSTTVQGVTGGGNPYTSPLLSSAGQVTISGKVTDKRGYSTTETATISVEPYSKPRILPGEGKNSIICTRCKSDGTPDAGGTYLLIQIGRKYSPVGNKNSCKLIYRYKTDAATDYLASVELLAASASSDYVSKILPNIVSSNTTAYTIQLIAEDDLGERDTVTVTIPTAFVTAHFPEGGHGLTLGGYHDPAKYDVFDCFFDAEFESNVSGKVLGLGKLPEILASADLNDYKDFGVWAVLAGMENSPSTSGGTLRVWSASGSGDDSGDIIQELVARDSYCTYRRWIHLSNGSWIYEPWKVTSGCDAVVEQGQTDGWSWRKFANGTAECWRRVGQTVDITTQMGYMYYGACQAVTFPFTFAEVPVCHISVECPDILLVGSYGYSTITAPSRICVFKPVTGTDEQSLTVVYHAIGRWK